MPLSGLGGLAAAAAGGCDVLRLRALSACITSVSRLKHSQQMKKTLRRAPADAETYLPFIASHLQVLDAVAELVRAASPTPPAHPYASQQAALMQYLHDQLLRSDDYVRKGTLARWLHGLIGELSSSKKSRHRGVNQEECGLQVEFA